MNPVLSLDEPKVALDAIVSGEVTPTAAEPWVAMAARAVEVEEPTRGPGVDAAPGWIMDDESDAPAVMMTWMRRGESPTFVANEAIRVFAEDDSRRLAHYALIELLRNGTSHSQASGAWLTASRADFSRETGGKIPLGDRVQISVLDLGIGVLNSLRGTHPSLVDAKEALEKSLWPHYSGAFDEGLTGSGENAGLGLFFIAEMTKLIGGRLLLASRGAALLLRGDPEALDRHHIEFIDAEFPGTLVVFEIPVDNVFDYDGIMEKIRGLAQERTPKLASIRWLKFESPPPSLPVFRISPTEMAPETRRFAEEKLEVLAFKREGFVLDFADVEVATQSWVHALLFEVLRVAWAKRTPIYIMNARPAVMSSLKLVENYALAG